MLPQPIQRRHPPEVYPCYYDPALSFQNALPVRQPPSARQPPNAPRQLPAQYALPLQLSSSYSNAARAPSAPDASRQHAEHVLRRKTPNGTLAAGYDGASVEWTSKPHAMKHILLPVTDNDAPSSDQSAVGIHGHRQHVPLGHAAFGLVLPGSAQAGATPGGRDTSRLPASAVAFDGAMPWISLETSHHHQQQQQQQQQHPLHQRAMDSMLSQASGPPSASFYSPQAAHVPSILQPPNQPGMGPTASNREGPFGPYWPDGAFIPYRPAALRDPRYYPTRAGGLGTVDGLELVASNSRVWPSACDESAVANAGITLPGTVVPTLIASSAAYGGNTPAQTHLLNTFGHAVPYAPGSHPTYFQAQRHANAFPGGTIGGISPRLEYAYRTGAINDAARTPEHGQFKDRLLAWAHGVYVELLASLHQVRSTAGGNQAGTTQQSRLTKTGIFPKPPRQPAFLFHRSQENIQPRADYSPAPQLSNTSEASIHRPADAHLGRHHSYEDPRTFSSRLSRPAGPRRSSERWTNLQGYSQGSDPLPLAGHSRWQIPATPHSTSFMWDKMPAADQPPSTITAKAASALEMVARLCVESSWSWIDGMLLAGCLAYGLGKFADAMGWYSRIIEVDPNHVEAISNLAATLLSLNRREEAEQYWLRSVQLRPSYFEAVEHLIGLLCNDHRAKEAVEIIQFVERSLRIQQPGALFKAPEQSDESESEGSFCSSATTSDVSRAVYDYDSESCGSLLTRSGDWSGQPGFGSSGFVVPGAENGRILALVHAKGNMLYALGNNSEAAQAFADVVLMAAGKQQQGIDGLIKRIITKVAPESPRGAQATSRGEEAFEPILLSPSNALQTARLVFPDNGQLPGLAGIPDGMAKRAALSTTSNALLSLAKIYQDGLSSGASNVPRARGGVRDILVLYYLSLSLHPSPSTANNVGILLASVQQPSSAASVISSPGSSQIPHIPGVVPGSGIALALSYYNYGLKLDSRHAHLFTNLGSLLKDIGQLNAAVKMYEQAVSCDGDFDIALANLANAVKDQGRISDAIRYYRRAVAASPDFAEAVCGLANALNSVCGWTGRGGSPTRERWHVDDNGMLVDARASGTGLGNGSPGWMKRVIDVVEKQLAEGERWGMGVLSDSLAEQLLGQLEKAESDNPWSSEQRRNMQMTLKSWVGKAREGARIVRLIERAIRRLGWQWYQDAYRRKRPRAQSCYARPTLPTSLSVPAAPTVLPFHTFTCPLSAKQIRMISERNALRISSSTLRLHWLPSTVFRPPPPPSPHLNVGYVSSDFNNHPLAHLMQSVFGLHDPKRVKAFCYATTASDNSTHRQQIEREAPVFHEAHTWSAERLVRQIVDDNIHILVNLNGYTRGARNEIFAARPAPIQMSFMGFAGTLGAEWCDYLLADETAVPLDMLRPWRRNVNLSDQICGEQNVQAESDEWVYSENIIFSRDTFFCCDHRQSAPDAQPEEQLPWEQEQARRWAMRKELFPNLPDDTVILGNFNQLYKIDPGTFRTWLRILSRVPRAVLWLLRFPDLGETHLKQTAELWAGPEVASRVIFSDVAPKQQHISRARVCDLFLDTPECNAHTTAADVLWSGTPLLTLPRYRYKMCSRMAASILKGALPKTPEGARAAADLIADSEDAYEDRAVRLGNSLVYEAEPTPTAPAPAPTPAPASAQASALASAHTKRLDAASAAGATAGSGSAKMGANTEAAGPAAGGGAGDAGTGTGPVVVRGTGRLMELRRILYEARWSSALFDTRRWVRDLEEAYDCAWQKWEAGEGGDIWL